MLNEHFYSVSIKDRRSSDPRYHGLSETEPKLPDPKSADVKKYTGLSRITIIIAIVALGVSIYGVITYRLPFLPFLMAVLVIALSTIIIFLLRRHRRIYVLVDSLMKKVDPEVKKSAEENLKELNRGLDRLVLMDRDHHLIRLLKDESPSLQPILDELKFYNVDFTEEGFILVAFNACRHQSMSPPRHFRLRDKMMWELLRETAGERVGFWVLDLEDMYVCLFNVPFTDNIEEVKEMKQRAEEYADKVIDRITQEFGLATQASISELHKGVLSLSAAYKEVQGLFEYRKITGNPTKVITYTDYYISFDSWYEFGNTYHKFEEVRRLITSIYVGNFSNAKLLINELIENDYSKIYPSLLLARVRLFGIIDASVNAMGLLKEDLDYDFLKKMDPTTRIVNCTSYDELQSVMNGIFDEIIEYNRNKDKDSPPEWFENIKQYIDTHYNDVNINVAKVADHFEISAAYYARIFKHHMGMSPLDYIHKLRMRSAKKLMSKGVSVKDAANIVGYGNPITMNRVFKRYEGVTPGSYLKH